MKAQVTTTVRNLLAVGGLCFLFTAGSVAQDTSKSVNKMGSAATQVKVERGEIVNVYGDEVLVKLESGELRLVTPSPGATITVDGKQLTIKDLQPGMKVERATITTTTNRDVVTTRTIEGKVWHINPPISVILQFPDGKNKQYKIPKGQMFEVDGKQVSAFHLKKGMNVKATVVTTVPYTDIQSEMKRTGTMPPPPPAPAAELPIIEEVAMAAPAPAMEPEPAPKALPKTGSELPLIGLLGFLSLGASLGLRRLRA